MGPESVRWGVLGAGAIAEAFCRAVRAVPQATVEAVASREMQRARAFVDQHAPDARPLGGYAELLEHPDVDAVYIATPHPQHARWVLRALEAGLHVLCEKPAGIHAAEVSAMLDAAERHDRFFMEAFKDRFHPLDRVLTELLDERAVGDVTVVEASFGMNAGDPAAEPELRGHRLFDPGLAGGGILDLGCYAVQRVRRVAGLAGGGAFLDPDALAGGGTLGPTGVDVEAAAVLTFPGGVIGRVATSLRTRLPNAVTVFGSQGRLHLPDPWVNDRVHANPTVIQVLDVEGQSVRDVRVPADTTAYGYQLRAATEAILAGHREHPSMSWADSLGNARTLDRWRRGPLRLVYPIEEEATSDRRHAAPGEDADGTLMLNGRPLAFGSGGSDATPLAPRAMRGLTQPVSPLILGCATMWHASEAALLLDAYYESGGRSLDTAYQYARRQANRRVGRWIQARGVGDGLTIFAKVACNVEGRFRVIRDEVLASMEHLGVDRLTVAMLHRDQPDMPVERFLEVLAPLLEAGHIEAVGLSNWSLDRVTAYNRAAEAAGLPGAACLSNQFSLARMDPGRPLWRGCVGCSDPASRRRLGELQLPNLAWSAQARGYFAADNATGRVEGHEQGDFDSPENRVRRTRARELAAQQTRRLGEPITATNVALAYVLQQPFPSFAVVGPTDVRQWREAMPALRVRLTPQEMAYLDLAASEPG